MQASPFIRSGFAQTALVSLLTFAALALLALVLAYWTWAWMAPRAEPRIQAAEPSDDRADAAYGLFGNSLPSRNTGASAEVAISLVGVVAAAGSQSGYALLRLNAKQNVTVREGAEIEPGVRLVEVHVDHIVLDRSGTLQTVAWPNRNNATSP